MDYKPLLLSQRPPDDTFITLAFGPGVLRFLGLKDLNCSNADTLREEVRELSNAAPNKKWDILDWGGPVRIPRAMHYFGGRFNPYYRFIEDEYFHPACFTRGIRNLTDACDVFEAVVNEFLGCPFPSIAYWKFADLLKIGDLRLSEFRESWCPGAWRDNAVLRTYQGLEEYFVVENDGKQTDGNIVFKRTPFFNDRMYINERMEKRALKVTDQANLAGASFATYVYLMEDLRNSCIKIGKSSSPRKREKTLQSEEPNVLLRFAIPCEDKVEKELHNEFATKRVRGEWFQLDSTELLDLIKRLAGVGDSNRVIADYSWIGRLIVHSGTTLSNGASQERIVSTSVDGRSFEEILARVHEARDTETSQDAIHDLDELISRCGHFGDLYRRRARIECSLENFTRALFDINDSIRLEPESASSHCLRGKIRFRLRDYQSALSDFNRSLELSPNSADALYARGTLKCRLRDYPGALQDLNNSILSRASSAATYHSRGVTHARCGNLDEAMNDYMKAISLNPKFAEAFVSLGILKHKLADVSGALREFDHALILEPDHANASVNKAFLLAVAEDEALLDAKQAKYLAETVLQLQPEDAYALNAKACALAALGKFASAVELETRAMRDKDWAEDLDMDGGAWSRERIALWEAGSLWRPKRDKSSRSANIGF